MSKQPAKPRIAIACGGTGGHLFPGLAVAGELSRRGCAITLLISQKEIDQQAIREAVGVEVMALPAVALQGGAGRAFCRGAWESFRMARTRFRWQRPQAVLAMGGFTSAPPVLAGKCFKAATFLHESNTIPGRANRWLAPWVDVAFTGFDGAARRLQNQHVVVTGTPVRPEFFSGKPKSARQALGLWPDRPVLLVMGGSQGASGVNEGIMRCLPELARRFPELQSLHVTGARDEAMVRDAYRAAGTKAVVFPFLTQMDLALRSATLAVSRAGASSLAELAAVQLPAVLVPYPSAADNHQLSNARAWAETGAAIVCEQDQMTRAPEELAGVLARLLRDEPERRRMAEAAAGWHRPEAACLMADCILSALPSDLGQSRRSAVEATEAGGTSGPAAGGGQAPADTFDLDRDAPTQWHGPRPELDERCAAAAPVIS